MMEFQNMGPCEQRSHLNPANECHDNPLDKMSPTFRHPQRLASTFFLCAILNIAGVDARGRGGGGGGIGDDIGSAIGSLDLPPIYAAIFAIAIIILVFTLSQFIRAIKRLKTPVLPPDTPTLPYQVGKLFPALLFFYTFVFIVYNVLYAVFVAYVYGSANGFLPEGFPAGMSFVAELSDVTLLAALLSLVAYRERIQLNPAQSTFNLKAFLDGWLLTTVLILGIAADALTGLDGSNMSIAYQAFLFVASLDLIGSAIMVYIRFGKSDVRDPIIRSMVFIVSPFIFIGALFRIIDLGLVLNPPRDVIFDFAALELAGIIIGGVVSIVVVEVALRMGAPPKPAKSKDKGSKGGYSGSGKA
ncbi:hypothetical protein D9756_002017 [Leucocoprinus leucothites]|uniref:Uncharacterized protein n=1 Tax=Leucocoprinus leucothites TaxID=201217 RepID=A0A8H5LLV9_9AGAR|nr:hypothetical protein D9756_002017 [Leucoagaricus leucothites]